MYVCVDVYVLQKLDFFSTDNDLVIFLSHFVSVYQIGEDTLLKRCEAFRVIERIRNKTSVVSTMRINTPYSVTFASVAFFA